MHVAVISPINTPDGISRYSKSLYAALPKDIKLSFLANQDISNLSEKDDSRVSRLWIGKNNNFDRVASWVQTNSPDLVHIQLHPEYFPPECLSELLPALSDREVMVTMHSFGGWYTQYATLLNQSNVKAVIIHKLDDAATLISNKLHVIPLGYNSYPQLDDQDLRKALGIEQYSPIILTHGLITPNKGLLETAIAINQLKQVFPDILWLAANALNPNNPSSQITLNDLENYIETNNLHPHIHLVTKFLTDIQASSIVQVADIGLFAYKEVGEGASDAVRKFISCGIPTVVSDIPVMGEFKDEVYKITDNTVQSIVKGITELWKSPGLRDRISTAAQNKATELSWDKVALRLLKLYSSKL